MMVVGLTGGIGAGKSTVAAILGGLGASVIDVDDVGRWVLRRHCGAAYAAVVATFGQDVVGPDGEIDRARLAARVFGNPVALGQLTTISHPAIDSELSWRVAAATTSVVVLDMAVLVESQLGRGLYDQVVVVEAPWPVRLARLRARGLTDTDATARRDAQATDEQRRAVADYVVINGDGVGDLGAAVTELWRELISSGGRVRP